MSECQFCRTEQNVEVYVPGGATCNHCKKNLDLIREWGFGIPQMRVTKEMHIEEEQLSHKTMKIIEKRLEEIRQGNVLSHDELKKRILGD